MSSKRKLYFFFLTFSMVIFGTIGIFRRYIPLSSALIAMGRGAIGALFLGAVLLLRRKERQKLMARDMLLPIISGVFIGLNWVLLFEAYNYTSVGVATLCYYTAPIFVILASPFAAKERLSAKQIVCVLMALCGMIPVSGILSAEKIEKDQLRGILLGLGAAVLYASVILMNKRMKNIPSFEKTTVQLTSASVAILPYILVTEGFALPDVKASAVILLITVGILHTGIAYTLYFASIEHLEAQRVALLSYIDPVVAILLSGALLGERIGAKEYIGALLILGSMLICELPTKKQKTKEL